MYTPPPWLRNCGVCETPKSNIEQGKNVYYAHVFLAKSPIFKNELPFLSFVFGYLPSREQVFHNYTIIMVSKFLYLLTSTLALLFSFCVKALSNSNNAALNRFSTRTENTSEGRLLTAARVTSRFKARGVSEMLSYNQKLHYIEGLYSTGSSNGPS